MFSKSTRIKINNSELYACKATLTVENLEYLKRKWSITNFPICKSDYKV